MSLVSPIIFLVVMFVVVLLGYGLFRAVIDELDRQGAKNAARSLRFQVYALPGVLLGIYIVVHLKAALTGGHVP